MTDGMQSLADEVAAWMGSSAVSMSGTRALPAATSYSSSNNGSSNVGSGNNGYGAQPQPQAHF